MSGLKQKSRIVRVGKAFGLFCIALILSNLLVACSLGKKSEEPRWFVLAVTNDLNNSGLLDVLLPPFEQANNLKVKKLAVSYGQALAYARDGGVDALLIESSNQPELANLAGGAPAIPAYNAEQNRNSLTQTTSSVAKPTFTPSFDNIMTARKLVFWADLVLVGPNSDVARVGEQYDAGRAFKWMALNNAPYIVAKDAPALREQQDRLWKLVGRLTESERGTGYRVIEGDSQVALKEAASSRAYTLVPYYLYLNSEQKSKLKIILANDATFFIGYELSIPNLIRIKDRDVSLSQSFAYYLTNSATQSIIYNFKKEKSSPNLFQTSNFTVYQPS